MNSWRFYFCCIFIRKTDRKHKESTKKAQHNNERTKGKHGTIPHEHAK